MSHIGILAGRRGVAVRVGAVSVGVQRDRSGAPMLTIDRVDRPLRRAGIFEPWCVGLPSMTLMLGGWSVCPQVSRDGCAIGRLWVAWFR